jgi:alcohol dehydrogenase
MENFTFFNPTEVIFGAGEVEKVGKKAKGFGQKVLLVYGGGSIKKSGLYDRVLSKLMEENISVWELSGVEPNPRLTTVNKGIELCKTHEIELILAVGGGSTIDASKAIALGALYYGDVWDFYTKKAEPKMALPVGVVLTHAATGSEMNFRSVVTNWEEQLKLSLYHPVTYPKFSILDPTLTYTVPKEQIVYGTVDMLSHVFEQYFSPTNNTPLQERLCESVMLTVIENAPKALENPDDYASRANLMLCAMFGLNEMLSMGMEGDFASHKMEHELSAIYDIPHGGGLAIVTPRWMEYVVDDSISKFVQFSTRVWGINPQGKTERDIALEGIQSLKRFYKEIGAPASLADYGIGKEQLVEMSQKAVSRGPIGGIKKLEEEDVLRILEACL